MFKHLVFCGAVCGVVGVASTAQANGFYVSGSLGASTRPDAVNTVSEPTDPFGNSVTQNGTRVPYQLQSHIQYTAGVNAAVAAGYRFDLGPTRGAVRTELELQYGQYSQSSRNQQSLPNTVFATTVSSHAEGIQGLQDTYGAFTVNAFYDLPKIVGVSPYVGVGVGYHVGTGGSGSYQRDYTISSGSSTTTGSNTVQVAGSHTDDGLYLVEVGVSIPLSKHLSIAPAYRYTQLFNGLVPLHIGKVGLRYSF